MLEGPLPASGRRRNAVLVVTPWAFEDALVQRYTLPYLEMVRDALGPGGEVILVTQESGRALTPAKAPPGIRLVQHPYAGFGLRAVVYSLLLAMRLVVLATMTRPRAVHAFGTPAGVHAYLVSVALRLPLVIDSFEPHAESMVENGTWRTTSPQFRLLDWFERRQARRAVAVVATTAAMRSYARARWNAVPPRFYVKPACVDLERFHPPEVDERVNPEVLCIYAGKIGGIYLEVELFEMLKAGRDEWGGSFAARLLTDAPRVVVERLCREVGLDPTVVRSGLCAPEDVPTELRRADFAVNPVKPVPTKRYCTSIKDGEYWATGLPVLIPAGISEDSDVIAERRIGVVLTELAPPAYGRAMREMAQLLVPSERGAVRERARQAAVELRSFDLARPIYAELYS